MEGKLVDREKNGDIDSILDRIGLGRYQARALLILALIVITDGMELIVVTNACRSRVGSPSPTMHSPYLPRTLLSNIIFLDSFFESNYLLLLNLVYHSFCFFP